MATNASGGLRVCCNALPKLNLVRDEDGHPMRLDRHSLKQAWNSPTYKTLRQQLLNSERPEMCQRCFREEDSGVESARQKWAKKWAHKMFEDPEPEFEVKYFDLRLGNLCNLKCRMCNPYASSKWVDEWNQVANTAELVPNFELDDNESQRLKKLDWPENESTWENLGTLLDSIEEIYLTGGEPFLSLKQVDFLKHLIDSGKSSNIILKYNTNMTVLPKKLVDIWKHFKKVRLNVSLDGIGPTNDYIRHPANWATIEKNMDTVLEMKNQGIPVEVGIHTTVQMYNILQLDKIVTGLKKRFGLIPYLNILNHPHCLNIRTLPSNLKSETSLQLRALPPEYKASEIVSYMNGEDWSSKYFSQFIEYTRTLDNHRSESFDSIQPELSI